MPARNWKKNNTKSGKKSDPSDAAGGALIKGLTVLKTLQRLGIPLNNQQLAEHAHLPRSTVSRLTGMLTAEGFLSFDEDHQRYRLGPAVLPLAQSFLHSDSLTGVLGPAFRELALRTKGTVGYGVRVMLDSIYLGMWHGVHHITLRQEVGTRFQLIQSALGLAILAGEEATESSAILDQITRDFSRARRSEVLGRAKYAVDEIREAGFYVAEGILHPDINAVAIPFRVPTDPRVYSVSLGGPSFWLTAEILRDQHGPALLGILKDFQKAGVLTLDV